MCCVMAAGIPEPLSETRISNDSAVDKMSISIFPFRSGVASQAFIVKLKNARLHFLRIEHSRHIPCRGHQNGTAFATPDAPCTASIARRIVLIDGGRHGSDRAPFVSQITEGNQATP